MGDWRFVVVLVADPRFPAEQERRCGIVWSRCYQGLVKIDGGASLVAVVSCMAMGKQVLALQELPTDPAVCKCVVDLLSPMATGIVDISTTLPGVEDVC